MENNIEKRTRWDCPDKADARILAGPNLVKPLHSLNPRTIMGGPAWDRMRKRVYYLAKYKCEICGADCSEPGSMDAHELYSIDYEAGAATFSLVIGICKACHNFYHSGRLITLFKQGVPFYSKKIILSTVEHGFKLIYDWNKAHPDEPKLKAYATFLEYAKQPELAKKMEELIKRYEMEFWEEDKKKYAEWGSWKLIFGKREYPTPYKDYSAWEKAMEKVAKNDYERNITTPFKGGPYDEILNLIKEEK